MDILSAVIAAIQAVSVIVLAAGVVALYLATRTYARSVQDLLAALREQTRLSSQETNARARLIEGMEEQRAARPQPIILPQAHVLGGPTARLLARFHNFGGAPAFQIQAYLVYSEREHLLTAWAANVWPGATLRDGPQWASLAQGENRLWEMNLADAQLDAHNTAFVLVAVYEDVSQRRFVAGQPYLMDKDDEGHLMALPQEAIYPQEWKELFSGRSVKHD